MPMGNHPCPCGKIFPSAGFHTGQSPRGSRLRIQIDTPSFTISSHSCWGLDDEALSGTTVGVASLHLQEQEKIIQAEIMELELGIPKKCASYDFELEQLPVVLWSNKKITEHLYDSVTKGHRHSGETLRGVRIFEGQDRHCQHHFVFRQAFEDKLH
ncbi:hypothetical protein D0Y65_007069 [Glycine soja]|uniref:Uncharacterized protein n=1 Tax=Glycine soja TaxID=3848 RepID=A0A445LBN4_GLYSO|nr:hypothetical protein D0Y65_007069 [Glycine soja]